MLCSDQCVYYKKHLVSNLFTIFTTLSVHVKTIYEFYETNFFVPLFPPAHLVEAAMSEAAMGLPGPAVPKRSLAVVLGTVIAVALVSQAAAMKCYQAPKSWPACWTDPNGEYEPCPGFVWGCAPVTY